MHGDSFGDEVGLNVEGLGRGDWLVFVFDHGELGLGWAWGCVFWRGGHALITGVGGYLWSLSL